MKNWKILFPLILICALASCVSSGADLSGENLKSSGKISGRKITTQAGYLYEGDIAMWNHIFGNSNAFVIPQQMPASIVIPHHNITEKQINSFYKAISKINNHPSVIVILCTDHFEQGKKNIVAPKNTCWKTPDGPLFVDEDLLSLLLQQPEMKNKISLQDKFWVQEHGIFIHTPFLKHYFPQTKILPVLLKGFSVDEEYEDYKKLAACLARLLPEDALLIGSIDFSHYQIPAWTNLHDSVTEHTIQNMENPRHIEIDSRECMTAIFEYNKLRGSDKGIMIHKTSTADFIPGDKIVSTSHQYWAFYNPEQISLKDEEAFKSLAEKNGQKVNRIDYAHSLNQTILLTGSGKVNEGIRTYWEWDRYKSSSDPGEILLHDMAGSEARFLTGFDAIVFDPESDSVFSQTKHGTTLEISTMECSEEKLDLCVAQAGKGKASGENKIRGLVLNALPDQKNPPDEFPSAGQIKKLLAEYDFVLCRADYAGRDTFAWVMEEGKPKSYNLGILYSEDKMEIKGAVLALDWFDGKLKTVYLTYESENGVVPAIEQYSGEP